MEEAGVLPSYCGRTTAMSTQMCGMSAGIAVLPRVIGDQVSGIRRLRLNEEPPTREIWVGYHRDYGGCIVYGRS